MKKHILLFLLLPILLLVVSIKTQGLVGTVYAQAPNCPTQTCSYSTPDSSCTSGTTICSGSGASGSNQPGCTYTSGCSSCSCYVPTATPTAAPPSNATCTYSTSVPTSQCAGGVAICKGTGCSGFNCSGCTYQGSLNTGSGPGGCDCTTPSSSPAPNVLACATKIEPSDLGINSPTVCDRLHDYVLVNRIGASGTASCLSSSTTCSSNSQCPQSTDCNRNTGSCYIEPSTSNWCYGFRDGIARCLQLVYTGSREPNTPGCATGEGSGGPKGCTNLDACSKCVLVTRTDILPFYQSNGWNTSCSNMPAIVNNWCGIDPAGCQSVKSGACASACGSSASTPPSAPPSSSSPSAPPGSTAPSSAPSSAPSVTTTHYRIAENPTDLNTAVWQEYKSAPTLLDFEFSDKTPGVKSVFVEFKDSTGKAGGCGVDDSQPCNVQIQLLGEDPKINSCSLSFEGNNTILNLKGENFGSGKGTVKSGNTTFTAEQIRLWKNDSVQAVWPNAPSGEALPVLLTNTDGQQGEGQCSAISQLSVGAKFFCGGPPPATVSNVDLVLAGVFEGGKVLKQKVSIDTTGVIQGLSQKLEEDKDYKLSLKAPRSLRKSASFTAGPGSTNVSNFTLPLGDIFPARDADGKINTFDYGELVRQLIISRDASGRSADFNADSRVNSIDWACMRHDFNKEDDPEPVAGSLPSPSPSPSVSPSPSPGSSPAP